MPTVERTARGVRTIRLIGAHKGRIEVCDGHKLVFVLPDRPGEKWRIASPPFSGSNLLEVSTNHPELGPVDIIIKVPRDMAQPIITNKVG